MSKKKAAKVVSAESEKDSVLQQVTNEFDKNEWQWDDTATISGVSEKTTPAIDKKYGEELSKALTHLAALDEIVLLNGDQVLTENALDNLTKSEIKRVVISYPAQPNDWITREMAKRQFVLNKNDTKYLQIAVKFAKDRTLKDTLLVFNRRK